MTRPSRSGAFFVACAAALAVAGCQWLLSDPSGGAAADVTATDATSDARADDSMLAPPSSDGGSPLADASGAPCDATRCLATDFERPDAPYGEFMLVSTNAEPPIVADGAAHYFSVKALANGEKTYLEFSGPTVVQRLACEFDARITGIGAVPATIWELAEGLSEGVALDVRNNPSLESLLRDYKTNDESATNQAVGQTWNHFVLTAGPTDSGGPSLLLSATVNGGTPMSLSFLPAATWSLRIGAIDHQANTVLELDNVACRITY